MKVLLATPLYSQHYDAGHFWLKALYEEGHEVVVWDYRHQAMPPDAAFDADVNLVLKGENIRPLDLPGSYSICYWPDAFERSPEILPILKNYHHIYTMVRPTPDNMIWLPTGWDPDIHARTGINKEIDTVYVGTNNSSRKANMLIEIGPELVVGNGWRKDQFRYVAPPKYLHDLVDILNLSRIAINVHHGDVGLNRKLFEMCACTFTLTDRVPGVEEVFGDIASRISYTSAEEARQKISYYLDHPKEREELWLQQKEKIKPYTYRKAVAKVLQSL